MTSTLPGALVGTTIARRFEVLAFVAAGGMGHIYRARDLTSGALVALKVLAPITGVVERFEREASLLAKLDHPGIVRYLDHGVTLQGGGAPYLAMEWLQGEDLAQRLGVEGTLGVDDALALAEKAAEALAAAHRAGVVHRDLKPANLFLVDGKFDSIRLVDFGIARASTNPEITVPGVVVGTPAYMAPEQVRGDTVGPRADVYAMGAVIFRCLVGRSPFHGTHHLAVLAKVVIEPPPSVRELRPDVSHAFDALIARLLSKEPAGRPSDGAALLEELRHVRTVGLPTERRINAAISVREQRIACVVLCAGGATAEEPTMLESSVAHTSVAIRTAVESCGGVIDELARGGWLVTIPNAVSSVEQATRAGRCALALAAIRPNAPIFVATGRVLVMGEGRVGEVIDRAAAALIAARTTRSEGSGPVHVDLATAALLEGRFRIDGAGEWRSLLCEEETVAPVRMLLGKPASFVGREAQLAMLDAALGACAEESRSGAALVVAPPALGKTYLVHELLRTSSAVRDGADVLIANGDPIRASSAFGIAGQIITRAAGIRDSAPADERAAKLGMLVAGDFEGKDAPRMRELLGELCGISTPSGSASAALRAARADASVMADAIRDAWTSWIGARATRATVIILLEDAHWADAASLRLLEAATSQLIDRPIFVLATARPEGSAVFAECFRRHGLVELTLGPLSPTSAERLVRGALGPSIAPELARALARRSGGHPFHLEELVRAVADGRGPNALPDSVLGMVQARLDHLSAEARRMLRAASVFGETFRASGIAALMGDDVSEHEVRVALSQLAEQEIVTEERGAKWHDTATHRFRHMLFRDAAYATLADADRAGAHQRAAAWLDEMGEPDAAVLGEHYDRGRDPIRAAGFFQRAAAQSLQRSDFERAHDHATRALALGPDASTEAALRAIEAEILYWRGEIATAAERAPSALRHLARGTPGWFDAVSVAVGALGQLGRNDEVAAILRDAASATSPPESRGAHVVALCRGLTQLFWAHAGAGLDDVRVCLDGLVDRPEPLDAYPSGWVHRVRGESAWLHARDVGRCLSELDASCQEFAVASALRPLCLSRLNAATLEGWSGDTEHGLELVALAIADAERLGAGFLLRYGEAVEGLLLAYAGAPSAVDKMERALHQLSGSPRLAFICHLVLASAALDRRNIEVADAHSCAATALRVADDLLAAGHALASRVALARGRVEDAHRLAIEAVRVEAACHDLELTFGMSGLSLAEALAARGDRERAKDALAPVAQALAKIGATIVVVEQRRRFSARPLANDRIARLADELGLKTETTRSRP